MNNPSKIIRDLKAGEIRTLVVYGTSLSFHLSPLLRDAFNNHYEDRLNLVNSGMAAKASRTGLAELDAKVLAHKPDAVLLEFAVNDAYSYEEFPDDTLDKGIDVEESRANLHRMIGEIQQALPECEIILQTMNPTFDVPGNSALAGSRRPELETFYSGYREVAQERDLKLIDNTPVWQKIAEEEPERLWELIPDGAHPKPAAIRSILVPHIMAELGFTDRPNDLF